MYHLQLGDYGLYNLRMRIPIDERGENSDKVYKGISFYQHNNVLILILVTMYLKIPKFSQPLAIVHTSKLKPGTQKPDQVLKVAKTSIKFHFTKISLYKVGQKTWFSWEGREIKGNSQEVSQINENFGKWL